MDYNKGLFKQVTEQTHEIEALAAENTHLKAENRALKKQVEVLQHKIRTLEATMEERIAVAVTKAVAEATTPILSDLEKAHLEIGRLKAIINKDSSNSSKPPRTNGFKDIPNSREKSNNPKGGQKGHAGHRLALPKNLDELVEKGLVEKRIQDHTQGSSEYVSRFVLDMQIKAIVVEHRYAKESDIPEEQYNEVSYGNDLKAMLILLLNEGIIAEKRLADMVSELTHGLISPSPATLERFQTQFANKLEESGELDAIQQDLINNEVMHVDDTSVRCAETIEYSVDDTGTEQQTIKQAEKKSFRTTVRVYSNDTSTYYTVNPKKDQAGVERDGILERYIGDILSHDHESKFYNFGKKHATCGGHLCRDLKGLRDLQKIAWADSVRKFLSGMNKHKNQDQAAGRTACDPELLASYENQYDQWIEQGRIALSAMKEKELGYAELNAMLKRLTTYKDCYLLFMRDYRAPFTNNQAERDLRIEKTKEKISVLIGSWKGMLSHVAIRSFISTVNKRKLDLFLAIVNVNEGVPVLAK